MRFPWVRRRSLAIVVDLNAGADARKARADAEARWGLIRGHATRHEDLRRRNHLADRMRAALSGVSEP